MQRIVTTDALSALSRLILSLAILAVCQSSGLGVEVPPTPGPLVPEKAQRLYALNVHTGEVAYDQTVRGPLEQAALSGGDRVAYAVVAPGSRGGYPRSNVFVQDFTTPVATLLSQLGAHVNALTATETRVMWATDDYFKVHSTVDGTTTYHDADMVYGFRLTNDVATYIDHSSYPSKIVSRNLVTGESVSNFHADFTLLSIESPRGFDAAHDSLIGVMIDLDTDKIKVAKLSPNAPPEYLPISTYFLASNGEQIVFHGGSLSDAGAADLLLYDSGHLTLLATKADLEGDAASPPDFSISANSIAWLAGSPDDRRVMIRDIASGVATQLPTKGFGLRLWDMNDDYILLSSDVIPVPEPGSSLLLAFVLASLRVTSRNCLRT